MFQDPHCHLADYTQTKTQTELKLFRLHSVCNFQQFIYDYSCAKFSSEEQSARIYRVHLFVPEIALRLRIPKPEG